MSSSSEEKLRLFRIHKTILQMLNDRGYLVEQQDLIMNYDQFKDKFTDSVRREHLLINTAKIHTPNPNDDKISIFFPSEEKVGVKIIKDCLDRLKHEDVRRGILVIQNKLSAPGKAAITTLAPMFILEVFQEAELLFNISEHMLVPKHRVLTDSEKKELLQLYKIKASQLPKILVTDPVARYYGLGRGDIVQIFRPSETAGQYSTYRLAT